MFLSDGVAATERFDHLGILRILIGIGMKQLLWAHIMSREYAEMISKDRHIPVAR
jgi:hypothetical protein